MRSIVAKTFVYTLLLFGFTYMSLVLVYKTGPLETALWGFALLSAGFFLFWNSLTDIRERSQNLSGIFSGILLWGALGEAAEHLELFSLPDWRMLPLLAFFTSILLLWSVKKSIPVGNLFALGVFNGIWALHTLMINQYKYLGRKSATTYPSALLFLLLALYFLKKAISSVSERSKMAYTVAFLLSAWTVLEYIWGWRWIPGPWMLSGE